ncbi:DUF3224 domain-containing protein [Thalassomonas sp. M1454]|uniref:DUF3224 domain-containing protein n=1 Tax=Thalassomonas sp. M1454 TaxID=2594477 RepID=UPI00117FE986|nr:DUF3224 domain-containing protein [Thalassomonas sp. M1454]TRX56940.1 DUF3224 domain-containing protein [Thalassomonas sp. M1454]
MAQQFNATSQITSWDETNVSSDNSAEDSADKKISLAKVVQQFSGDLVGSSSIEYVMCYQSKTEAVFTGFESISLTINDKQGQFIVKHDGKFEQGVASSNFVLVAGSATADFVNAAGYGKFKSTENGQAEYQFNLELV